MKAVVCTAKRGVFFGTIITREGTSITLANGQMCVYWDASVRGVVGLAATGPTAHCRVTAAAKSIALEDVTAVMECTDAAVAAWEATPWKN